MKDTDAKNHTDAANELIYSVGLATSPIWLGSLLAFAIDPATGNTLYDFLSVLGQVTKQGQLFIYASATLGPVFYIIIREWRDEKNIPSSLWLQLLSILVLIVSIAFYGIQTAGVWVDQDVSFPLSIGLFSGAVILLYIVKVYDNARIPNLRDLTRNEEEEFTKSLRQRRN